MPLASAIAPPDPPSPTTADTSGTRRPRHASVERASASLHGLRWFELVETRGHIEDGRVKHVQVTLKIGFTLDDQAGGAEASS